MCVITYFNHLCKNAGHSGEDITIPLSLFFNVISSYRQEHRTSDSSDVKDRHSTSGRVEVCMCLTDLSVELLLLVKDNSRIRVQKRHCVIRLRLLS